MGYTPHILIVGGGATGTAVARDLVIRGLDVTLVERGTLASGATGRVQGLLHSGARYAASEPELARRCLVENRTLRETATHCITESGGLLVGVEGDHVADHAAACEECGIDVEQLSGEDARDREPALSEDVVGAVRTPDGVVDPFRLTVATARGAQEHGATIRTHTTVRDVVVEDGAVVGVEVVHDPPPNLSEESAVDDVATDEGDGDADEYEVVADDVDPAIPDSHPMMQDEPDASGEADDEASADDPDESGGADDEASVDDPDKPGGADDPDDSASAADEEEEAMGEHEVVAEDLDDELGDPHPMLQGKDVPGSPDDDEDDVDTDRIEADYVVNAAGPWADDIASMAGFDLSLERSTARLVVANDQPVGTVLTRIADDVERTVTPYDDHTVLGVTPREHGGNGSLLATKSKIDAVVDGTATLVPSLAAARVLRSYQTVRAQSPDDGRGTLLDHGRRDDCWGMTTVVGGTLTTHRAVAERVADHVCGEFGIDRECRTDEIPLPGAEDQMTVGDSPSTYGLEPSVAESARNRLGSRAGRVLGTSDPNPVLCPCKGVTRREVQDAMADPAAEATDLEAVRVRTTATMGECQGGRCAHRLAAELYPDEETETVMASLEHLCEHRWGGQRDALWGEQLAQAARTYQFHAGVLNRDGDPDVELDISGFDDGPDSDDSVDRQPRGGYPI